MCLLDNPSPEPIIDRDGGSQCKISKIKLSINMMAVPRDGQH
jgi:hypothetical protein